MGKAGALNPFPSSSLLSLKALDKIRKIIQLAFVKDKVGKRWGLIRERQET